MKESENIKSGGNLKFLELDSYVKPKLEERYHEKWVKWVTQDGQNYFKYIIDRYHGSPTNNAIIQAVSDMIFGKGIDATDKDQKPKDWAKFQFLFKKDELRKVAHDFKMFNKFAFQIIYSNDRKTIAEIWHAPVNCYMPGKCNDDGDIDTYYFSSDWDSTDITPKPFPAFGFGELNEDGLPLEPKEIFYYQPYSPGSFYFSPVDYQGGLQYAEMEEGIADFHLNHLKNGFHDLTIVNFNNGIPDDIKQQEIEAGIKRKWSGTHGQRVIVSFNDDKEKAPTIDSAGIEDASDLFKLLSEEAMQKLMISHRITSPMLLGIKDNTGLGNNADELKTAYQLMDATVCRPYQDALIEGIQKICAKNEIHLDLFFKTLKPLEFATEEAQAAATEDQIQKEEGIDPNEPEALVAEKPEVNSAVRGLSGKEQQQLNRVVRQFNKGDLTENQAIILLMDSLGWTREKAKQYLGIEDVQLSEQRPEMSEGIEKDIIALAEKLGEKIDLNEYDLIVSEPAGDEENEVKLNKSVTGYDDPGERSSQDTGLFKIRYSYAPEIAGSDSREFCKAMVQLAQSGIVYRKEDIREMSQAGINGQFSKKGDSTYNIFKFKGGVNCHHYWMRKIYMRKRNSQGNFLPNEGLSNDKNISVNEARRQGVPLVQNPSEVATRPIDMPNGARIN